MTAKSTSVNRTVKKAVGMKTTQVDLKRQLKIQKVLYEIADAASAVRDMQSFYKKLHKIIGKLMYAENFFIALYDEQSDLIIFPYRVDTADVETIPPQPLTEQHGATAWVIQHGEALDRSSGRFDAAIARGEMEQIGTKSNGIVVPLKSENKTIGALSVQSYIDGIIYDAQDVELLTFVAQHISTALTRARAREAERQRTDELAILNSVGEAMAKTLDVKTVTKIVGDKVRDIFNAEAVSINLLEPSAKLIHPIYEFDKGEGGYIDYMQPFPLGTGLNSKVIQSRQPLLLGTLEEQLANGAFATPEQLEQDSGVTTQSWMGVPIMINDQVLGTVNISHYRQHAYNESHLRLLQTLASNMGVAIENARLFEAEQERVAELQIINSIQQGLAAELDFQAIVDLVGDKLREVFNTPNLNITWYDEKANLIHYLYVYEYGKRIIVDPQPPRPGGIFETLVKTRQPVVLNTVEELTKLNAIIPLPGTAMSKSSIDVPIISSDRVLGDISIDNFERENAFGESELRLLTTIAASLGTALENVRLFDEVQKRNLEISEALKQQTATSDVLRAMSGFQPDLRSLLETIAENIVKVCDANDAHIYRVEGKALKEWTHRGPIPGLEAGESLPLNRGSVIGRAIIDRQIVHIHDAQVEMSESEYPVSVSLQRRWGYRTVLATPLLRDGEPIGGIAIRRQDVQPFTDRQIQLIKTFADQAVIAIENVRLFDETQRLLKDTQQRNAELAIINSVQEGLARKLDFQGIIDLVGEKIGEIFKSDTVDAGMYDAERDWVNTLYYVDRGQRSLLADGPAPRPSLIAMLMDTHKPLLIGTSAEAIRLGSLRIPSSETEKDKNESYLGVPILSEEKTIGWMAVQSYEQNAYDQDDLRLLQTLASSISVALENARLFNETQRLLKETEERNAELAVINSVQEGLASRLEMQAIYELVGDKIRDVFDAQVVTINTLDSAKQQSILRYGVEKGKRFSGDPYPLSEGHYRFIRTRQPVVINENWEKRMREMGFPIRIAPGTQMPKSTIIVPLITDQEVKGSVSLQNVDRENAFGESDVHLLQTLANSMSVALENARLFDEVQRRNQEITEALEQQTASSEILRVIASSPTDIQPVLDTVAENAARLCASEDCAIFRIENEMMVLKAHYGDELDSPLGSTYPLNNETMAGRAILEKKILHIPDLEQISAEFPLSKSIQQSHRAFLAVPLLREGQIIGVIFIRRHEAQPFTNSQVQLVKTFADQAVIAIENVRLFTETQRLLKETEQRAAELAIINSVQEGLASKLDMQAIYDLVGDKVQEIFKADTTFISTYHPDEDIVISRYYVERGQTDRHLHLAFDPFPMDRGLYSHVIKSREPLLIGTTAEQKTYDPFQIPSPDSEKDLNESYLGVPLMLGAEPRGIIGIQSHRQNAFNESDVRLLQTLANSMSVALENARLFDETQRLLKETEQRAAELALINSVQQGLASKLDIQAIIDLVGDKIRDVFDSQTTYIALYDKQSQTYEIPYYLHQNQRITHHPRSNPLGPGPTAHIIRTRETVVFNQDTDERLNELGTFRMSEDDKPLSWMGVPMIAGDEVVGVISLQNADRENAYPESVVNLLSTIASSLAVALQNAQLFEAEHKRTTELSAISSVSQALVAETELENIIQLIGDQMRDIFGADIVYVALLDPLTKLIHFPYQIGESFDTLKLGEGLTSQIIESGKPLLINRNIDERRRELGTKRVGRGALSYLGVPIKSGRDAIGVLSVQSTQEENVFSESDTRLLSTLAINIGIAIERAQLFHEIQTSNHEISEALEQQTATSEILSIIAENPTDVQPVLDAVAEKAGRLCNSYDVVIVRTEGNLYRVAAHWGAVPLPEDNLQNGVPLNRDTVTGRAMIDKKTIHLPDLLAEPIEEYPLSRKYYQTSEQRTMLVTPLIRENEVIGSIMIRRQEVNPFSEKQVSLLKIFADQAAIAIENVRLFNEIQTRNREITEALEQQTAISEILRVTASSPTDIQPVMNVIAENARNLLNGYFSGVYLVDGKMIDEAAMSNFTTEGLDLHKQAYPRLLDYDFEYFLSCSVGTQGPKPSRYTQRRHAP